jgi:nicotinamide-nucleotide amidase
LVLDEDLALSIADFFAQRGYHMSDNNRRQARIPQGAIPLPNPAGTAPCFIVEDERGVVISLPGVPREMEYMVEHAVLPYLRDRFDLGQIIKSRTLRTCGIGESTLDSHIGDFETSANPTVGLAAHPGQSDIRITAKADSEAEADAMLAEMEARVRERVDEFIFGVDDDRLESVVVDLLLERGLTIAVAEISASGLLAGWLSDADPEGRSFKGAWVLPEISDWTLASDVRRPSEPRDQAQHLARSVRASAGASLGLAIVNRGPDKAFISVVDRDQVYERTTRFRGHEPHSHNWIASMALDLVRRQCLGLPDPA